MEDFYIIIILLLILIIIIYIFIEKYNFLTKIDNNDENKLIFSPNDKLFIKYSSIKNKLNSDSDYLNFYTFLKQIDNSIYISVIDNIVTDFNQNIELINNNIQKTKLKFDFKKLKNIFVIMKEHNGGTLESKYVKIILFYNGLIYNKDKFKFIENDFSGNTIVYKLNLKNKLFNHYLQ
jgi:hypothetical protein